MSDIKDQSSIKVKRDTQPPKGTHIGNPGLKGKNKGIITSNQKTKKAKFLIDPEDLKKFNQRNGGSPTNSDKKIFYNVEENKRDSEYLDKYRGPLPAYENQGEFNEIPNYVPEEEAKKTQPEVPSVTKTEYMERYIKHPMIPDKDQIGEGNIPIVEGEKESKGKPKKTKQKYSSQPKMKGKEILRAKKPMEETKEKEPQGLRDDVSEQLDLIEEELLRQKESYLDYNKESEYMDKYKEKKGERGEDYGKYKFKHHISGRDGELPDSNKYPYKAGLNGAKTEYKDKYIKHNFKGNGKYKHSEEEEGLRNQYPTKLRRKGKNKNMTLKNQRTASANYIRGPENKGDHSPISSKAMKTMEPEKNWKSEYIEKYLKPKRENEIAHNKEYFESWDQKQPTEEERKLMEEEMLRSQPIKVQKRPKEDYKTEYIEKYPPHKRGNEISHNKEYFDEWNQNGEASKNFRKGRPMHPYGPFKKWDTEYVDKYRRPKRSFSFDNRYKVSSMYPDEKTLELRKRAFEGNGPKEWMSEYIDKYPYRKGENKNYSEEYKYTPKTKEDTIIRPFNRTVEYFNCPPEDWDSEYLTNYKKPRRIDDMDLRYHKQKYLTLEKEDENKPYYDPSGTWKSEYVERYKAPKRSNSMENLRSKRPNKFMELMKYPSTQTVEYPETKWKSEYVENYIQPDKSNNELKNNKEYFDTWDKMKKDEEEARTKKRPTQGEAFEKKWKTEYDERYLRPNRSNDNLAHNREYFDQFKDTKRINAFEESDKQTIPKGKDSQYNTEYGDRYLEPKKGNDFIAHNKEYFDSWKKIKNFEEKEKLRGVPKEKKKDERTKKWRSEYKENYGLKARSNSQVFDDPYKHYKEKQSEGLNRCMTMQEDLTKDWSTEYKKKYIQPKKENNLINNKEYWESINKPYEKNRMLKSHLGYMAGKGQYYTEYNDNYLKPKKESNLINNKDYWESWEKRRKENEEQQKFRSKPSETKTERPKYLWNTEYKTNYLKPNKGNNHQKFNKEYFDAWRKAQEEFKKNKTNKTSQSERSSLLWESEYKGKYFKHRKNNNYLNHNKEYWDEWMKAKKANEEKEKETQKEEKLRAGRPKQGTQGAQGQYNTEYGDKYKKPKRQPKREEKEFLGKGKNAQEESQPKTEIKKEDETKWNTEYNERFLRPKKGTNLRNNREYWESWERKAEDAKNSEGKKGESLGTRGPQGKLTKEGEFKTEYNDHYLLYKKNNNTLPHNKEYFDSWKEMQSDYEKHFPRYASQGKIEVRRGVRGSHQFNTEYGDNYLKPRRFYDLANREYDFGRSQAVPTITQDQTYIPRRRFEGTTEYNDKYLNYGRPFYEKGNEEYQRPKLRRDASTVVSRRAMERYADKYDMIY
ncbi:MAG: hypothetical protein MJ252_12350 [archaeon]|nr:hypothetical protein [archaeon]